MDHRFEHLRGGDHDLGVPVGHLDDLLLDDGHQGRGCFHTQVTARHHHPVGDVHDVVQVLDRFGPFQFGDNGGVGTRGLISFIASRTTSISCAVSTKEMPRSPRRAPGQIRGRVGLFR